MSMLQSPHGAILRFGFRQVLRGAIILGLVAGLMIAMQGIAYEKAYPNAAERTKFAVSLASAPGLGFIYGDPNDLYDGTPGYMVYRVLPFLSFVTAVWGILTTTKLLRGAEEDGRYEVIRAGAVTPRRATLLLVTGFAAAWWAALPLSYFATLLAVRAGGISTTASAMWLLNLAIFVPGLLFAAVGVFTSQLGQTRGRALLYGMVPAAALWLARGAANTSHDLHWLFYATPFGWMQLVSPVHTPHSVWITVAAVVAVILAGLGIRLAQRDYDSSLIRMASVVKPRFALLRNAWQLALRQNMWVLIGWAAGALWMIGLIAALSTTAVTALQEAGGLSKAVANLGGTDDLKVAFLGAGMVFMVMVLLVLAVNLVGQIRRDEARQHLDNILVAPMRRSTWLLQRLLLGYGVVLAIALAAGVLLQIIASAQHISLNFGKVLATSVCVTGSVAFLLGLGALLYGLVPRLAVAALYAVIGWSFLITLLASAMDLNDVIWHSSLFQYTNFNLARWPDWATFGWFMIIAVVLSTTGMWALSRRDIVAE